MPRSPRSLRSPSRTCQTWPNQRRRGQKTKTPAPFGSTSRLALFCALSMYMVPDSSHSVELLLCHWTTFERYKVFSHLFKVLTTHHTDVNWWVGKYKAIAIDGSCWLFAWRHLLVVEKSFPSRRSKWNNTWSVLLVPPGPAPGMALTGQCWGWIRTKGTVGEYYRFVKKKGNSDLSNLKPAILERVWVSFFCYTL